STMRPTKETMPAAGALTVSPGDPARSTPRCPLSQRSAGGSKDRTTSGTSGSGQLQDPDAARAGFAGTGVSGEAPAGASSTAAPTMRLEMAETVFMSTSMG